MKLLLVDGTNLLFQMFYGMPARIKNAEGKPVHGILGFVSALLKIIKKASFTHVLVLFDGESHNPRKDISADYKANRPDYSCVPEEENPFSQMDGICRCLDFLGVARYETEAVETDDIISLYARTFGVENEVVISSFDSDFFQLITKNVKVLRYRGDNTIVCDEEYIKTKLGITPDLYADFKCLTGDSADNVRGARGIGPKTAAKLVNEYRSLENLIANADKIPSSRIRNGIKEDEDRLLQNLKLIRLTYNGALPVAIQSTAYIKTPATAIDVMKRLKLI